jgi:hypothetical protein
MLLFFKVVQELFLLTKLYDKFFRIGKYIAEVNGLAQRISELDEMLEEYNERKMEDMFYEEMSLQSTVCVCVGGEVCLLSLICGQIQKCPFSKTDSLETLFFFEKFIFFLKKIKTVFALLKTITFCCFLKKIFPPSFSNFFFYGHFFCFSHDFFWGGGGFFFEKKSYHLMAKKNFFF